MEDSAARPSTRTGERPFSRTRLLLILLGGAAALTGIRLTPAETFGGNANRFLATEICSLIVGLLFCAWLVRDSGLSRRVRRSILLLLLVVVASGAATLRVDFGGDMQQHLRPRRWVVNVVRGLGFDYGNIIAHEARTADVALDLTPAATDSYCFFGPTHNGVFQLPSGKLARDWTAKPPRQVWRIPIGKAWSSFAVVGHFGFTQQQTSDSAFEQVSCLDLNDGKFQWVHNDAPGYYWLLGGDGPRATPTFHTGKLYTLGSAGLLNCFDAATGKVLWSHDIVKEHRAKAPTWGKSSSPLVVKSQQHGDLVVLSAGGNAGHSLVAYRADDGKEVWHGGDDPSGYATPVECTLGGVRQIVIVNYHAVVGQDLETGAVLWRYDGWDGKDPKVPQPIPLDDRRVFISAGYGVGCRMLEVAKDAAGKWSVAETWKSNKFKPKFMNPVVRDGFAYGIDDGAFLMCVDLKDGAVKWRSQRGMHYGHGQLLLVGDLLVVQTEEGEVALVPADPAGFHELGRFTALPTGISWNQPVLWGNKLLVRNDEEAACYELPTE